MPTHFYGYGMKIVPDDDIVSETIQSMFVYIYEKRQRLNTPASVVSYMIISFRRMLLTEIEKQRRHSPLSYTNDGEIETEMNFSIEFDIESKMIKTETERAQAKHLHALLQSLTPQQREVIYLKYKKGLNNDEIAEILGIRLYLTNAAMSCSFINR